MTMKTWRIAEPGSMLARLYRRAICGPDGSDVWTPECVARACDEFVDLWPDSEGGYGHVVLSDYNFEAYFIGKCISDTADCLLNPTSPHVAEYVDTITFLAALLRLTDAERVFPHEPEYVDG